MAPRTASISSNLAEGINVSGHRPVWRRGLRLKHLNNKASKLVQLIRLRPSSIYLNSNISEPFISVDSISVISCCSNSNYNNNCINNSSFSQSYSSFYIDDNEIDNFTKKEFQNSRNLSNYFKFKKPNSYLSSFRLRNIKKSLSHYQNQRVDTSEDSQSQDENGTTNKKTNNNFNNKKKNEKQEQPSLKFRLSDIKNLKKQTPQLRNPNIQYEKNRKEESNKFHINSENLDQFPEEALSCYKKFKNQALIQDLETFISNDYDENFDFDYRKNLSAFNRLSISNLKENDKINMINKIKNIKNNQTKNISKFKPLEERNQHNKIQIDALPEEEFLKFNFEIEKLNLLKDQNLKKESQFKKIGEIESPFNFTDNSSINSEFYYESEKQYHMELDNDLAEKNENENENENEDFYLEMEYLSDEESEESSYTIDSIHEEEITKSTTVFELMKKTINRMSSLSFREKNIESPLEDNSPSPVRVKVPAFRKYDTIHSIVSNLIEGTIDEKDLHPNTKSPNNSDSGDFIKEASQVNSNNDLLSESFRKTNASIKFDKFAELLIYVDANNRRNNLVSDNQPLTQNTTGNKRNNSTNSLIESTKKPQNNKATNKPIEPYEKDNEDEKFGSILKRKFNDHAKEEIERAVSCDKVPVEDFIVFFETHERRRMDAEPMLGEVRQRQLENYYEFVDEP
ncbi:protein phosphatase regulator GIP1 ASCRUDRAFT_116306 [Ascoidea rubescens DSM 1968]|uniref:Uncharacterized protein n=1 Tax=Ascoidea rubescens DSM 1968 TaxID=1344418 RepID=A0A1D2VBW9_9ASCO|nr:hypothetical protein ASCRUDRAFT_116306 [Ascoidea rubescens DSM 1968]ODV59111.1 hypothetical protein ASCRUDRAFT_116306 [Ascoidea rubescens DSM 1968]